MKFRPEVVLYSTIDNLLHPAASQLNSTDMDCLDPLSFENMSHTCPFLLQLRLRIFCHRQVLLLQYHLPISIFIKIGPPC